MTIKLSEFIDHVTEHDEKYLGLALHTKAFEILRDITHYRGKIIDGYLKLPLI